MFWLFYVDKNWEDQRCHRYQVILLLLLLTWSECYINVMTSKALNNDNASLATKINIYINEQLELSPSLFRKLPHVHRTREIRLILNWMVNQPMRASWRFISLYKRMCRYRAAAAAWTTAPWRPGYASIDAMVSARVHINGKFMAPFQAGISVLGESEKWNIARSTEGKKECHHRTSLCCVKCRGGIFEAPFLTTIKQISVTITLTALAHYHIVTYRQWHHSAWSLLQYGQRVGCHDERFLWQKKSRRTKSQHHNIKSKLLWPLQIL